MTVDYKADATSELRKYLWSELLQYNIFDIDNYYLDSLNKSIVPIFPVQQSPEMNQFLSGKKHLVYDKIGMSYEENWMICNEQILFTIYATEVSEINEIRNFITDLFRRMDSSARDVRNWEGISDKFIFHTIYIADISPISPSEEMKGFFASDIVIETKYSRVLDSDGRYA